MFVKSLQILFFYANIHIVDKYLCRSGGTADAHDSKSCGKPCGFKSHLRHQKKQNISFAFFISSVEWWACLLK